jgi:hypothetical protein
MQVLKTIPGVPAIAEIVDSVYRVNVMSINFVAGIVSFTVTSSYQAPYNMNSAATAPVSREVSFAEIAPLLLPADIPGFIAVIRQSLALAMNVSMTKVPEDIFAA